MLALLDFAQNFTYFGGTDTTIRNSELHRSQQIMKSRPEESKLIRFLARSTAENNTFHTLQIDTRVRRKRREKKKKA